MFQKNVIKVKKSQTMLKDIFVYTKKNQYYQKI